jgi:hypothetical protein
LARTNYSFEKRRRELAKKKKKEEKRQRKEEKAKAAPVENEKSFSQESESPDELAGDDADGK